MALFDMTRVRDDTVVTTGSLTKLKRTTFAAQGIQERSHLQAALRDHIELISDDLFVVAEEFGDFEGASRRIDLLCVDRNLRLVVVELKRSADGGHMELQALRYAAMVSTMTFDQVVRALARYRAARVLGGATEVEARSDILAWLELDEDDDDPVVARDVGIVLASEDFSQEITTTVLWLNEFHDFDIRCVRLSPYLLDERLLLDVQQVVPLPEASAYTVRVREKEVASRQVRNSGGADTTKFVVQTPSGKTEPLPKRRAILRLVQGLVDEDVEISQIKAALPPSKLVDVDGVFRDPDELWNQLHVQRNKPDRKRWHVDHPMVIGGSTWVLHSNWGTRTREHFQALLALAPAGFAVYEEGEVDDAAEAESIPMTGAL